MFADRPASTRETDTVIFDDLRAIQLRHGFLPKAELEELSLRTQAPLYQIHAVASFCPEDVQIRAVSCLGRCDLSPAVSVNDHIFTNVTAAQAEQIARSAIRGDTFHEPHPAHSPVQCKSDPYSEAEQYGVVRTLTQTKAWDGVL